MTELLLVVWFSSCSQEKGGVFVICVSLKGGLTATAGVVLPQDQSLLEGGCCRASENPLVSWLLPQISRCLVQAVAHAEITPIAQQRDSVH